jgi:hypothetical protein
LLATLIWAGAGLWWHAHVRSPMMNGPIRELHAGLSGEIAKFKAGFFGSGASADDRLARDFLEAIRARYGELLESRIDPAGKHDEVIAAQGMPRIAYLMRFSRAALPVEARFVIVENGHAPLICKWQSIHIVDPQLGDLRYPESAN